MMARILGLFLLGVFDLSVASASTPDQWSWQLPENLGQVAHDNELREVSAYFVDWSFDRSAIQFEMVLNCGWGWVDSVEYALDPLRENSFQFNDEERSQDRLIRSRTPLTTRQKVDVELSRMWLNARVINRHYHEEFLALREAWQTRFQDACFAYRLRAGRDERLMKSAIEMEELLSR